jgi:hypothetical protein
MSPRLSAEPDMPRAPVLRLNLHGQAVDIRCSLPGLRQILLDLLRGLAVAELPEGFHPVDARLDEYDDRSVARMVSGNARRICAVGGIAELWGDGERFWMLDESWGICEINLLRRSWRACLLPRALNDPYRTLDHALFWPLSQLLVRNEILLVPGASVIHRGRGVLLLAPFDLEPELHVYARSGRAVISQRWSALRFDEGKPLLLTTPGRLERFTPPHRGQLRSALGPTWYDLTGLFGSKPYAWCDVIVVVDPARRSNPSVRTLRGGTGSDTLRTAWPVPEVMPGHASGRLLGALAHHATIVRAEFSRDASQLQSLLSRIEPSRASTSVSTAVAAA